mgnify:FL=1
MNKKTKIQENKAITLIALVITIIVLIILAGVAINLAFGQNGLVARAKTAREEYSTAEAKEKLEQEILNIQIQAVQEGKDFNLKYLKEKIDKTKYEITLDDEENPTTAVVKEIGSNYYLTVDSKLKVIKVEEKEPQPQYIKFSELAWASGKASVELSTKESGIIEYKVGKDGIYQAGTTISNLSNGDIVYVRVNNNGTYTDEETLEIKDTIEPEEFTITASDITYEGVKLAGSTQDLQTGIKDYTYVTATKTNEIVKEIVNQTVTEYTITGLSEETEYVVYMLAYDNAGNLRKSNEVTITTTKIPTKAILGEYIDYPIDLNNNGKTDDWVIFYKADGNAEGEETGGAYAENVGDYYIIAADYLKNTDSRLKLSQIGTVTKNGEYNIYWANTSALPATVQVTGTESRNVNGRTNTSTTINKLFMQNKFGALNSNYNSRAVSALINTANWDGYVDTSYADYAIGVPTLEMWVASWNVAYGDKLKLYTNKNSDGYFVGTGSNSTTSYNQPITSVTDWENNTLYFPHVNNAPSNCYGIWLVSPSAGSTDYLMGAYCGGGVTYYYYNYDTLCLRPVVHLKSGTTLQKVDGVWRIQ